MRPDSNEGCGEDEAASSTDDVLALHVEWDALPPVIKHHLNFDRFMSRRKEHSKNNDLKHATSKLTLIVFDGNGSVTV